MKTKKAKWPFQAGQILVTRGAWATVSIEEMLQAMQKHLACNWGEICEEDKAANDYAVKHHERILSSYLTGEGNKFWIITEADRSATTILLPSEY